MKIKNFFKKHAVSFIACALMALICLLSWYVAASPGETTLTSIGQTMSVAGDLAIGGDIEIGGSVTDDLNIDGNINLGEGTIRFDDESGQLEIYDGDKWRIFRTYYTSYALDFDGTGGDRVDIEFLPEHNNSLTFTSWLYWRGFGSDHDGFFGAHHEGQNLHLEIRDYDVIRIAFDDNVDEEIDCVPTMDQWIHFAMVYNHGEGETRIYLNGVLCDTISGTIQNAWFEDLYGGPWLGDSHNDNRPFNGLMNDARVYYRALGEEEIYNLYEGHHVTGDLVAHWPMNEGSGDTAYDQGSDIYHGTIHGATWVETFTHPNP